MAGGFSINAALNSSKWLRGVSDMESSLKDLEGALDDAGAEVKKLDREGEKGFKSIGDGADDASDEVSDLEKRLRSIQDETKKVGRAGDDIGDVGSKGMRKMGDAGEEVSGELRQNLGETFSSFRGDLEDIPQIAQDVFGGLAGSVGGMLPAFGLAAGAAGIGLLIAAFQTLQEQEEERKERVHEWAQAYVDAAGRIENSIASLAAVDSIYTDSERYAEAEKNAKNWGVSVSTAVNAMAGDMTSLGIVEENLATNSATVGEQLEKVGGNIRGLDYDSRQLRGQTNQGTEAFNALKGEMADGSKIAENHARSLFKLATQTGKATGEVDDLGNEIYALPDGEEIVIDAKTKKAYSDVDAIERRVQNIKGKSISVGVDVSGLSYAQQQVNRFYERNNGRTLQINQRVVTPAGWDK